MNDLARLVWPYAVGYVFATVGSWFAVMYFRERVDDAISRASPGRLAAGWLAPAVGLVESVLYTTAILVDQPAFVGIWLALKVVGTEHVKPRERIIQQRFGILTGFVLAFAFVGASTTTWLIASEWEPALAAPMALLCGSIALSEYAARLKPQP